MQLDSVQIGVDDLAAATRAYALVLGVEPVGYASGARRFQLACGAVELEAGAPGLHAIRFVPADADGTADWPSGPDSFHGLDVRVGPVAQTSSPPARDRGSVVAIDHVVVRSPDLERAIALWRDRLGVRLALDREFPGGLRLLFFRSGGITLEFAGSLPPPPPPAGPDRLYGVTYRVDGLDVCRSRLVDAGLDVSAIRPGHKAGTMVATVRSGTAAVPTLLLEDPTRGYDKRPSPDLCDGGRGHSGDGTRGG